MEIALLVPDLSPGRAQEGGEGRGEMQPLGLTQSFHLTYSHSHKPTQAPPPFHLGLTPTLLSIPPLLLPFPHHGAAEEECQVTCPNHLPGLLREGPAGLLTSAPTDCLLALAV